MNNDNYDFFSVYVMKLLIHVLNSTTVEQYID